MQKPTRYDVIIAGAGPAGSTAATLLARGGHSVLVLEKADFPRYHIGESLLPATCPILDRIGLSDAELRRCFWDKNGAQWYWGQENELWDVRFGELEFQRNGLHVIRSEFDRMLRDLAQRAGAEVRHGYHVQTVARDAEGIVRVQGEDAARSPFAAQGRFFIDATGQSTLLSASHRIKRFHPQLAHLAVWGYWNNVALDPNLPVQTLSAAFDPGWCWFIPLRDGTVSVGIVLRKENIETLRARGNQRYYLETLQRNSLIVSLLKGATLAAHPIRVIADYSYESSTFTPDGHLLVGDAAAFIDPIFSVGVHLAMAAAEQAAIALDLVLSGEKTSAEALAQYEAFYKQMFRNMRTFVLFFYGMNASREDYFWKAKSLMPEALGLNEREAFIALISGQADLMSKHIHANKHFTAERIQMLERLTGKRVDEAALFAMTR